jgi:hypothetical protein
MAVTSHDCIGRASGELAGRGVGPDPLAPGHGQRIELASSFWERVDTRAYPEGVTREVSRKRCDGWVVPGVHALPGLRRVDQGAHQGVSRGRRGGRNRLASSRILP